MGQDKACILVNGIPMLRRVYDVAAQCTDHVSVVTPWPNRYRSMLPPSCRWIVEQSSMSDTSDPSVARTGTHMTFSPHGPLVGFAYGLEHLAMYSQSVDWVMLLACDLPCLDANTLKAWIKHLPSVQPMAVATLPLHSKGWEPLCGFYRLSCLSSVQRFADEGGRSFQRWLSAERVESLTLSDCNIREMLTNCNTPSDLERLGIK